MPASALQHYLVRWDLAPDGEPFVTGTSTLLPVKAGDRPAMLKIAQSPEEERGGQLMACWGGDGLAPVLAHEGKALLLARAEGADLAVLARSGRDEEATAILCAVAAKLHSRSAPSALLVPLERWFADLEQAAVRGGLFASAAETARDLLSGDGEFAALHGDLHHGNVLHFDRWRAIDPKGLLGDRAFDYVNILRNPDAATATQAGRFERQAIRIAREAKLDVRRLLQWAVAFFGLSAAWQLEEGGMPELDLALAARALAMLEQV